MSPPAGDGVRQPPVAPNARRPRPTGRHRGPRSRGRARPGHTPRGLSLDGAHQPDDLRLARAQLDRLPVPWLAIPGNHDIGDNPSPVTLRPSRCINVERCVRWNELIGADRWSVELPDWSLVAINAQLIGIRSSGEGRAVGLARRRGWPAGRPGSRSRSSPTSPIPRPTRWRWSWHRPTGSSARPEGSR